MATRNSATDTRNMNKLYSSGSFQTNFGLGGPKPSPSPTWTRQQLDNWIGDTVAEGDFSTQKSRLGAVSAVAKKALQTGVVSNRAAANRTARYLLRKELVAGAKEQKGRK